jgi:hypothetical protein
LRTGLIPLDSSYVVGYCTFVPEIPSMLDTDLLIRFEQGETTEEEFFTLFQQIYDTKAYQWLQGYYGRELQHLINEGYINV